MVKAEHLAQGRELQLLDPFAGTGRIHALHRPGIVATTGVEIEREWANLNTRTRLGDALSLPFDPTTFDVIATSPTYGNRLADSHAAKDGSIRHSYTHDLGKRLHPNNSGQLQWGPKYRTFHVEAWREANRVLKPGGLFILNVSDHIRQHEIVPVSEWHLDFLTMTLGFKVERHILIPTPRLRFGANSKARVERENLYVMRKPKR